MEECKNPTCTNVKGPKTYCSRECQVAMRTRNKGHQIPDLWLGMDEWRMVKQAADREGLSVRQWAREALVTEARFATNDSLF
jgi:hypothetical protein